MRLVALLPALAGVLSLANARAADERMYVSGTCRTLPIEFGKNVCVYGCLNQAAPIDCNDKGRYDPCLDKVTPNPCLPNEVLLTDARDYKTVPEAPSCKRLCPGKKTCYTQTNTYKNQCCGCPTGWKPKIPGPYCVNGVGTGSTQFCVGCKGAGEKLVWNTTKKIWECLV
ncbi:hypothetical protein BCR34DRAFT_601662 [Clohesyomyces aquaticus]|uniref:Uncharacterized protein n=1 Tax=Clohesyomyces aquaticus TaxID=1231657 RepID=A0A1Y1ZLC3_9PLEO|nr:hypothetical protein BCR34DRAFT_601662 [Clohesyomyces aquaticus]